MHIVTTENFEIPTKKTAGIFSPFVLPGPTLHPGYLVLTNYTPFCKLNLHHT